MFPLLSFLSHLWAEPNIAKNNHFKSLVVTEDGRDVRVQWESKLENNDIHFVVLRKKEHTADKGDWKVVGKYFDSNTDSFLDTTTELHSQYSYQVGMIPFSKFAQHNKDILTSKIQSRSQTVSFQRSVHIAYLYAFFDIVGNILLYIGSFLGVLLYTKLLLSLKPLPSSKMSSTNIFRLSVLVMFLCWIPIVGYLSQFAIIDGWSIPYALLRPWIGWSAVLIALSAHVWKPQRMFFVLGVVNAWIALQDFSVRSPSNKGISVLSWNVGTPSIGTKESQSLECVLDSVRSWEKEYQNQNSSILFLQEIEQNSANFFKEEQQHRICSWQPYVKTCTKWSCNGSMICLPEDWSFARTNHRQLRAGSQRGALQTEIITPEKQVINVFNLHLQSLYQSGVELKHITNGGDFRHGRFLIENPIKAYASFAHMLEIHQTQVDKLFDVFSELNDPILLIGDFNSVSTLPIHSRFRRNFSSKTKGTAKKLTDAHRETGIGYGFTAVRSGVPARVDFLYAQEPLEWTGQTRVRRDFRDCSDHWAIESWMDLQ